jgi:1-aminocyclopropane-1-carboxylate synthase
VVLSREKLAEIVSVTRELGIECIVDEIYSNSIYNPRSNCTPFYSALNFSDEKHVHTVSGFAKDFGVSGLKVGWVHTRNEELLESLRALAYLSPASTQSQASLESFISNQKQLDTFLLEMKRRLHASSELVTQHLKMLHIPFIKPEAGLFIWLRLKEFSCFEEESALWESIFTKHKINLSPGHVFHASEPGWFRMCFARPTPYLREGLTRITNSVQMLEK